MKKISIIVLSLIVAMILISIFYFNKDEKSKTYTGDTSVQTLQKVDEKETKKSDNIDPNIPSIKAPQKVTEEETKKSGSLEIRLWGSDKIPETIPSASKKILIVPYEENISTELKNDIGYLVSAYPPVRITGIKPGRYWIAVTTPFDPMMGENLSKMPSFNPTEYYAWDGNEENPFLWTEDGSLIWCSWYSAWIKENETAVTVAIRMKKGSDINSRLNEYEPRQPFYSVSIEPLDEKTKDLVNLLERYGKAFHDIDSILSVQQSEGGAVYHLVAGEKAEEIKRSLFGGTQLSTPVSFSASKPNVSPKEKGDGTSLLPSYGKDLNGPNEVRVMNPNKYGVLVGLRNANSGLNFEVASNANSSVFVPDGKFEIYFVYSDKPDELYKGDGFTLKRNGIEIKLVKVVGGNYGIKRVN